MESGMNVEFICGRIEDLCTKLQSLIPSIEDIHSKYSPDVERHCDEYMFAISLFGEELVFNCIYEPEDVIVASGTWVKGYTIISCHAPVAYSDFLDAEEGAE